MGACKEKPHENPGAVQAFMESLRRGDVDAMGQMLAGDPSLLAAYDYDCFGGTALIQAASRRDRRVVDFLLEHGADIDQRSDWWAGSFGVLPNDDREFAEYLIDRGATVDVHTAAHMGMLDRLRALLDADPTLVHARGGDGQFPLHFAGTPETIDLLLERGADIHARDIDHESTAAQWQATRNAPATRHLMHCGAETDIFMAAAANDADSVEKLLADDPTVVGQRVTPDRYATSGNTNAMHIYLYTLGLNATALHAAAIGGSMEAAKLLLDRGADSNAAGGYDDATPLHLAAWNNRVAMAETLLDHAASIDRPSGSLHKNEPIGWAVVAGAVEMVEFLVGRGALVRDVHIEDARACARREIDLTGAPIETFDRIAELLTRGA